MEQILEHLLAIQVEVKTSQERVERDQKKLEAIQRED
jgi:hypothetical protein